MIVLLNDPIRLRRIILWVMLAALGISAGLAVLGVLTSSWQDSYKMIGTCISAAIASALLFASCRMLDSAKNRPTGLLIMALIVVQFVLALLALWNPLESMIRPQWLAEEKLGLSALIFPVVALPASLFSYIRHLRGGKLAGSLGLAFCGVSWLAFLLAIWRESANPSGDSQERAWGNAWALWVFAIVAGAAAAGYGTGGKFRPIVGLTAAFAALVITEYEIWDWHPSGPKVLALVITIAVLLAHINLLWLCSLKTIQELLRLATSVFAFIAGAGYVCGIFDNLESYSIVWRWAMGATICSACGTVAIGILAAFNRRALPVVSESEVQIDQIVLVCPLCQRKESVPISHGLGQHTCLGCGMLYTLRVTAPRCANCDYLLLMFRGDRCPECGTPVAPLVTPATAAPV